MSAPKTMIEARELRVTGTAAVVCLVTALVAAVLLGAQGIYEATNDAGWPETTQVGLLGLVGLGTLGFAIAATGDAVARAYASAHVVAEGEDVRRPAAFAAADALALAYRPEGEATTRSAVEQAAERLAEAYEKAHAGGGHDPVAPDAPQPQLIRAPAGMRVTVGGRQDPLEVLALRWSPGQPGLQYLVGTAAVAPDWHSAADVTPHP